MRGLSFSALKKIAKLIDNHFDSIALDFLGLIPKSKGSRIFFDAEPNSLVSLFLEALDTKSPTKTEEDTLKSILMIADGYVDALKERTKAQVLQDINAYVNDQKRQKKPINLTKVNKIFTEKIDKAKVHFEMIAGQESYKTKNVATALKFTRIGESLGEDDPTVFFVITRDEKTGPYEFILHTLPDKVTPRLWKLSEIQSSYYKPGDQYPSFSGLHPNCFVGNSGVNIFCENKGYVNIKDIKIGDRVLTHTGKFKKVINTLDWYNKKYYGKFYKIKYKGKARDGDKTHTLKVTPEHPFMTQRGWVKAEDLRSDDKFMQLKTYCGHCGNSVCVKPTRKDKNKTGLMFCSKECISNYQWSLDSHKENISKKSSSFMKKKLQENPLYLDERIAKANEKTRELVLEGEFWAQKKENLETLQKNMAVINKKLQTEKTSKEELDFYKVIKEVFPTVRHQEILHNWCVDFYIPEIQVNIEYDGGGHYLPVYTGKFGMETFLGRQKGRDSYLNKCGIHVLRYSEIPTIEKLKEDVLRVSNNHDGKYFFETIDLISIKKINNDKGGYRLYDLTVEDDESFVVNGVISHNCRCKISYLPKGYGFDGNGRIKFIAKDHDEFKVQREKYGLPEVPEKISKKKSKQTS